MTPRRTSLITGGLATASLLATAACTVPPGLPGPTDPPPTSTTTAPTGTGGPRGGARTPCAPTAIGSTLPAGVTCRNIEVDGYTREYLVYVPEAVAAAPTTPVPLVFMFHGSSGDGEKFLRGSGWREQADAEGFVAVFPTGLEYFVTEDGKNHWSTKWSSSTLADDIDVARRLPGYPADAPWPADDVSFTEQMIDDVSAHLAVDPARIHVSGFSNGGGFSARLASELSDRIASVATSGAPAVVRPDADGTPVAPTWQALGTLDANVGRRFGVTSFPLDAPSILAMPGLSGVLRYNATTMGAPTEPCDTPSTAHTTTIMWCAPGAEDFRFTMVEGLTHVYPNGYNAVSNPAGVEAAEQFWLWFEQHPLD